MTLHHPSLNLLLFVQELDDIGGAQMASLRLAGALHQRGHRVTLLTTQPMSRWRRHPALLERTNGFPIIRLPIWQRTKAIAELMLLVEAFVALRLLNARHVLQMRGLGRVTVRLAVFARRQGMRTICVPMATGAAGDVVAIPPHVRAHDALAFDCISCLTHTVQQEITHWGYPVERTTIIPNGVDTDLFSPPSQPTQAQTAIYVGQFRPEKRPELLLEAWRRVQQTHPQARLTLVGGAPRREEFERRAQAMGLRAAFLPVLPTDEVRQQLQEHAVFIMPGVSEGMSNALLEAMAVGLAPVVSDTPGNRALVTHGVNGLTYEPESADALAAALRRLFDHPAEREMLGAQARADVVEQYSLTGIIDRYIDLYQRLLNATHAG